jgi:hypothetical protein
MGELLDRAFSIYRRHPLLFIGIMAVPSVFALAASVSVTAFDGPAGASGAAFDPAAPPRLPTAGAMLGFVVGYVTFGALYAAAYMLALGATTIAVSELYLDRISTIRSAFERVRTRAGRLFLLGFLVFLRLVLVFGVVVLAIAVSAGVMVLSPVAGAVLMLGGVAGGLCFLFWFMMRYALAVPVVVLEDSKAGAAIRRSIALSSGHLGRVFLLLLCSFVLTYAALAIFQAPFTVGAAFAGAGTSAAYWLTMAGLVSGSVGGTLTAPVLIIGLAVMYYDIRIRKEALDVQMVLLALDSPGAVPPDPAASPTGSGV